MAPSTWEPRKGGKAILTQEGKDDEIVIVDRVSLGTDLYEVVFETGESMLVHKSELRSAVIDD